MEEDTRRRTAPRRRTTYGDRLRTLGGLRGATGTRILGSSMDTELVYTSRLADYDLGDEHPLRPERFALAVELMESYRLVPPGTRD
jgi:hypothetical protein